ncbi:MAG: hypothetical protein ACOYMH_08205 [Zwartia sp.]
MTTEDYKTLRQKEYPEIVDQLDLIFHGGIGAWQSAIREIKLKYPKPQSQEDINLALANLENK